jgi:hypothetical protein
VERPRLEVADIFRLHGPAWREAQRGHLSLAQLKVMSAITQCRTAALGGHVLRCEGCKAEQVSYNSCRHCPKCQSAAAQRWLDARQADLLPVEYFWAPSQVAGRLDGLVQEVASGRLSSTNAPPVSARRSRSWPP